MYTPRQMLQILMDASIGIDGSQDTAVRNFMDSLAPGIDPDDDDLLLGELGENDEERYQAAVTLWRQLTKGRQHR
jgi:hypothetical protein